MESLKRNVADGVRDPATRLMLAGLVLALLVVSWPLAASLLTDRRIANDGELVRATVSEISNDGTSAEPVHRIVYRLPADIDDSRREAIVSKVAWDRARLTSSIRVRVLVDEPDLHQVEGAQVSHPWRWVGVVLDLAILALIAAVLFVWVPRRRLEATLADWDTPPGATQPEDKETA